MSRASVVARGRSAAAAGFVDTCVITRAGASAGTFNNTTGQYDGPSARVTVYAGPCRIQITALIASSSGSNAGERLASVQASEVQLPVDGTGDVSINDVVEVTASTHDAELVGRKFTVEARHEKTHATSRRLRVAEVTG